MIAKCILLTVTTILAASVLALVGVAGMDNTAHAQSGSLKPANVQALNGPNAGEAIVSWDAVTGVTWYRVGWISQKDYLAAVASGGDALQSYVFADIRNTTTYTVVRLEPGENYLFTVASIAKRFGASSEASLAQLTLNSDTTACPAPTPGVTPTPTPGATTTPTPGTTATPTPLPGVTGGDYDYDDDGLIEIRSIAQLDAIRHDLDGNGAADDADNDAATYAAAFPGAAISMGCPTAGCTGYELATNLDYGTQVSAQGWQPIGYWRRSWDNAGFTATFDGGGYTISNLFISRANANHVGLFAFSDGIIRRAALLDVNVVGNGDVGGLAGLNRGTIADSYVTGNVIGSSHNVGGLVGRNFGGGTISNSYATSTVVGVSLVGGLVGQNNSTITGSHATGSVASDGGYRYWNTDDIGGLVGRNSGGTIAHSYSTGEALPASTTYTRLGGLVGNNTDGGGITDSHSTRSVTGGWYSGGLVGHNENGTITRSYATGAVSGSSWLAGGLVGSSNSVITASYATGNVSGGNEYIGGLVGWNGNNGSVTVSYAAGEVSSDRSIDTGQRVGGLAGRNEGTITGSYATGDLFSAGGHLYSRYNYKAWDNLGGLVSENSGTITGSYSTAAVSAASGAEHVGLGGMVQSNSGTVIFSYWDTQTSGQESSAAGVGKTTTELQSPTSNTGIYATWNPNWWDFGTASQYPVLKVDGLSVAAQRGQVAAGQPGTGKAADHAALVAFYQATGGANWANNGNWLSDQPVSQWHGVTTDDDGRVTKVILSSNNLTGAIPTDLAGLTKLQTLTLRGNRLTGEIPDLSALSDTLGWLNLEHNELSGEIPLWLGDFTELRGLGLGHNRLSGTIPAELGNLNNLRVLYLDNQSYLKGQTFSTPDVAAYYSSQDNLHLNGVIPPELDNLANLEVLDLSHNRLNGSIPPELGNLSSLTRVSLWNNRLSGSVPFELGKLSRLTRLSLGSNQLSGTIPSSLGNLSNLESLGLQRNQLSGTIPAALGNLSNLTWLDFDFNRLTGPIPPELGNLSNLTVLRLGSNQLSGSVPPELGRLASLIILGLGNNQLTGSIPPQLGSLASLTRISLWNNDLTGPIPSELGNLSRLTKLSLGSNQLTGPIPPALGNLANLNDLALQSNDLSGSIPSTLGRLANLTDMRLYGNQLTGVIPSDLGNLTRLTRLYLQGNQLNGTIPAELGRLSNLDVLNLSSNQLTGAIPSALGAGGGTARAVPPGNGLTGYDAEERGGAFPAIEIAYAGPGQWSYGQTPEQVGSLASLRVLNLSYNRLSGALPPTLASLGSLKRLYLNYNNFTGTVPAALNLQLETQRVDRANEAEECGANSTAEGVQNDRSTLQYLYTATDGRRFVWGSRGNPSWTNYAGWEETFEGDAKPLKEWYGVTVNSHGRVTHLNLSNNGLAGDTADWHKNLEILGRGTAFDSPIFCLEVLDLSDNDLGGDIGAVLLELFTRGEVELRLSGNNFKNWLDDDPESVTLEDALPYVAEAVETQTGIEIGDLTLWADQGAKLLTHTGKSRVTRYIARSGGRISSLSSFISHDHEEVVAAFVYEIFGGEGAGCRIFLSDFKVRNAEQICETGFVSDVEEPSSFWNNNCAAQPCNRGCPNRPLGCRN